MAIDNTNTTRTGKAFNPTVTALFENEKFGEGSLLSAAIDANGFKTIQQHIQIGSKLVVRRSKRLSKTGNVTYFMEVLPPLVESGNKNTARRSTSANDDI